LIRDIRPASASSDPRPVIGLFGVVYLIADDGMGPAWWVTDGTTDGTRKLVAPDLPAAP